MASAAHDEPSDDRPDDEAWADIVARLGDVGPSPDDGAPHVVRPAHDPPAPQPPADDVPVPQVPASGRDWDGTAAMAAAEREVDEAEHFVPPDPGPVLGGDPLLTMAWLAAAGMPVFWVVVAVAWQAAPATLLRSSAVVFGLGVALLVWRMPHRRPPDDHDDGAVV